MGETKTESAQFTKLPIGVTHILDDYTLVKHGLELEQIYDAILNASILKIKTYILAEEIDCRSKTISINTVHPIYQNWWQHFKGDIFPDWLKRRFPPKFLYVTKTGRKRVTFRKYAIYPKANILFPKETGELVRFKAFIEEDDVR